MSNEAYQYMIKKIAVNIENRELVLRWKNPELEALIYQELGKKAKFYVTRDPSRVNNIDTFSDNLLKNQKDKYYLVLDLKWNSDDWNRYKNMGYSDVKDICWILSKPYVFNFDTAPNRCIGEGGRIRKCGKNEIKSVIGI